MKSLTTKLGVVGILMISCATLNAQTYTVQSGNWNSPSTWSNGIIPDASSGVITINHKIIIPLGTLLTVDELIVKDTVHIESGATVILNDAVGTADDLQVLTGGLKVWGKFICRNGAAISGTTNFNTFFYDGSTYEHQYFSTAGAPPLASWSVNSNLEITGYTTSRSLNSNLWSQSFGNVIYNCAGQSSIVSLGGRIKTILGNFLILNTNNQILRLSEDQTTPITMTIGGNFIINGKSAVWFSRAATISLFVAHNFNMLSTATNSCYLTTTGKCQVNVEGDFEMNSGSILRFASGTEFGSGTLRVNKDFKFIAGTIRVSDGNGVGTLEMNGSSNQNFSSLGSWTSGVNLVINNAAGVNVESNSKVEANVLVAPNGKLILPKTNFTLHGDLIVQAGGKIKSNQGTLILAGAVNQSIALNNDTLHHITINKASGTSITLSNAANLSGLLSILSTNTAVVSNGNLTMLSQSDDGNADAAINMLPTGSSILGNVKVQRFMSGEGRIYRYISSPVMIASVDSLMDDFPITGTFKDPSAGPGIRSSSPSFFYYDETFIEPLGWIAYPSTGNASENFLEVAKGYAAFIREASKATLWDVTGVLNQGDIDFPITYTDTGNPAKDGWNLVGNPYPSAIDWSVVNGWDKVHVDNGIAVRDNGAGMFQYWDGEVGSLGSGRIAKGQSFWIKTNSRNPNLKIKELAKASAPTTFYRKKSSEPDYLEVRIESNEQTDKTYLRLRNLAHIGYDSLDVVKFQNDVMSLAFETNETSLAISAIDRLDCSQPYLLTLTFAKKSNGSYVQSPIGNYQISVNAFGLFATNEIYIHDDFTNRDFNLATSLYSFSITNDSASFKRDRFWIHFISPPLHDSVSVEADSIICDSKPYYKLALQTLERNTKYGIFIADTEVDSYLNQQRDSISFQVETKEWRRGITTVEVKANNLCATKVIGVLNVWKQTTTPPNLTAVVACNSESTTLHIEHAKDAVAFNWYDHNQDFLSQTQDSTYVVDVQKPNIFYASSVFDHDCVSELSIVRVTAVSYDSPVITENQGTLFSNHLANNHWSLNGKEIVGATQDTFQPKVSGNYTLSITKEGCIDSVHYHFVFQDKDCHVFPNPMERELYIIAPLGEQIRSIEINNISGQTVGFMGIESNAKSEIINMEHLANGVYFVNVLTTKNQYKSIAIKK